MDIREILKKVAEGKELSAEEKAFLAKYDQEKDENRIPKSRLDRQGEGGKGSGRCSGWISGWGRIINIF